jgi:hypothetical protein
LLNVPVIFSGFRSSYSAANEWWARAERVTPATMATREDRDERLHEISCGWAGF